MTEKERINTWLKVFEKARTNRDRPNKQCDICKELGKFTMYITSPSDFTPFDDKAKVCPNCYSAMLKAYKHITKGDQA